MGRVLRSKTGGCVRAWQERRRTAREEADLQRMLDRWARWVATGRFRYLSRPTLVPAVPVAPKDRSATPQPAASECLLPAGPDGGASE